MREIFLAGRVPALVVLVVALITGCAEQRAPINRVQANALMKSFFVGELGNRDDDPEFFMHVSIVDVGYGANSDGLITSTDGQPLVRVRWDITEDMLLARLGYELIEDSDYQGTRASKEGQIVAAFEITKHFDLRNDYNPSTGEDYNVVVENDSDQPWYARQFFRVDWSRNLVTTAYTLDTLSQIGIFYAVEWEPIAYYVSDAAHPDAPVFDQDGGYFDITTKALAKPGMIEDPEWGDFPACWLTGAFPEANCNPTEVTLRSSFLRVGERDYEPIDWDGERMEIVGVFSQDRFGYDRGYGVVDDKWHRFASRWNMFHASHLQAPCATVETTPLGADPNRDLDGDGTEDECTGVAQVAGSRCDVFAQRCTIPVRERSVRTIAWHVNPGFPPELFDTAKETLGAWNDAARVALLTGRLSECRRTGGADCEATMAWPSPWSDDYLPPIGTATLAEVPNVFVLCHNPVASGDDPACGAPELAPRLGDLRFNFVTIINEPQALSPWGIMADAEDPLSGEKISGSVNLWGAVTDHYAVQLADLLMLQAGLIDPADYIKGENVSSWVAELEKGGIAARAARPMSEEELTRHKQAFDPQVILPYVADLPETKPNQNPFQRRKLRAQQLVDSGKLGPGNAALAERLRRLQGSAIEAHLFSGEMTQLAGEDPTQPPSAAAIRRASPFGRNNPAMRRGLHRRGLLERARRSSCRLDGEAAEPDNLIGLAAAADKLFGKPDPTDKVAVQAWREQIYEWARVQFTKGVLAHELGHAMGLRHNFSASFDALNYDPQYWQLRSKNGTVTEDCAEGTSDGSDCVGPRWRDPITKEELENNIGLYATTSVMDYPGETAQDQRLLGKYDRAAMRTIYGNTVDVWAEQGVSVTGSGASQAKAYKLTAFASSPGLTGVFYFPPVDLGTEPYSFIHYSQYQNSFDLITNCQASDAPDAILGQKCSEQPLDVVDYRDMKPFTADIYSEVPRAVDPEGRVRRGYMFNSDEYADTGNVPAFSNDSGADAFEIVRFLESQYQLRYVLDGFRRNRVSFNSWDATLRLQSRYFDPIQAIAKTFAFGALLDVGSDNFLDDGNYGAMALGGSVALDMFAQMLTRPEPGYFCSAGDTDEDGFADCYVDQPYGIDQPLFSAEYGALPEYFGYNFRIALGEGRYLHNDFDYSKGYWWSDYQSQVGAYYEKIWATYYLSEAFDYFISSAKEDFVDSRYKNVNFATVFPEQVRRLYNNLLTDDFEVFAPRAKGLAQIDFGSPTVTLAYPTWSAIGGLGSFGDDMQLVDPDWGWNERIFAMVWGAMYFTSNWSYDWLHQARIAALPTELPSWPDDAIYAFVDPKTGQTYRAHSSGKETLLGLTRQKSAGARMLEWANKLVTVAYEVERDDDDEPITDKYGTPVLKLKNGAPELDKDHPGADLVLQRYVAQIDMFRQITAAFEQPLDALPDL